MSTSFESTKSVCLCSSEMFEKMHKKIVISKTVYKQTMMFLTLRFLKKWIIVLFSTFEECKNRLLLKNPYISSCHIQLIIISCTCYSFKKSKENPFLPINRWHLANFAKLISEVFCLFYFFLLLFISRIVWRASVFIIISSV